MMNLRHGSEAGHVKLYGVPEDRNRLLSSLLVGICSAYKVALYIRRGRIMCT